MFFFVVLLYIGILEMTQLTRKLPIALRLILRGSPGRQLNVPSEGHEGKPYTQFLWGRAECTWKRNKSLLQVHYYLATRPEVEGFIDQGFVLSKVKSLRVLSFVAS